MCVCVCACVCMYIYMAAEFIVAPIKSSFHFIVSEQWSNVLAIYKTVSLKNNESRFVGLLRHVTNGRVEIHIANQ